MTTAIKPTAAELEAELVKAIRENAEDEINRTAGLGSVADGYQNALYIVEAYLPRIHSAAFLEGAKLAAKAESR